MQSMTRDGALGGVQLGLEHERAVAVAPAGRPPTRRRCDAASVRCRSSPRSAAKHAPESKRGTHSQSIEPSSATRAAVWVSPMSAYCSMRDVMAVPFGTPRRPGPRRRRGGAGVTASRSASWWGARRSPRRVDQRPQRVDRQARLVEPGLGGAAVGAGIGDEVDHRQLLEADGVVGDDVGHRHGGQLGPGPEQLLVLLLALISTGSPLAAPAPGRRRRGLRVLGLVLA